MGRKPEQGRLQPVRSGPPGSRPIGLRAGQALLLREVAGSRQRFQAIRAARQARGWPGAPHVSVRHEYGRLRRGERCYRG